MNYICAFHFKLEPSEINKTEEKNKYSFEIKWKSSNCAAKLCSYLLSI